jgi:hypothetical protein
VNSREDNPVHDPLASRDAGADEDIVKNEARRSARYPLRVLCDRAIASKMWFRLPSSAPRHILGKAMSWSSVFTFAKLATQSGQETPFELPKTDSFRRLYR